MNSLNCFLDQEFQVPKMDVSLNLISVYSWGWVFPYISRIYTAYSTVAVFVYRGSPLKIKRLLQGPGMVRPPSHKLPNYMHIWLDSVRFLIPINQQIMGGCKMGPGKPVTSVGLEITPLK